MQRLESLAAVCLTLLIGTVAALAITEMAIEIALSHARWLPVPLLTVAREYYFEREVSIPQRDCGRYDPTLGYAMRPGVCEVREREFSLRYHFNAAGLRDDAASLRDPVVVVLGDSVAMGWGVEEDEAFPALLEERLGVRVLNAGVPSYATARELMLLRRLGLPHPRVLVIQYSWGNDLPENASLVENDGRIPILSESRFDAWMQHSRQRTRYWPGRHVSGFFEILLRRKLLPSWTPAANAMQGAATETPSSSAPDPDSADAHAFYFVETLRYQVDLLRDMVVVVLPVGGDLEDLASFARETDRLLAATRYAALAGNTSVVTDHLATYESENNYALDGHPKSRRHVEYADVILAELGRRGVPGLRSRR